jgi:hypothetical protein
MRVSHETIYRALNVQPRGSLARELTGISEPGVRSAMPGHIRTAAKAWAGSPRW